jgi:hypothetical protein
MPNLGFWQEFGTNHPALEAKFMAFMAADGTMVFTRGHRAFSIAPRPFLNPSLEEQKSEIVATIRARLSEVKL